MRHAYEYHTPYPKSTKAPSTSSLSRRASRHSRSEWRAAGPRKRKLYRRGLAQAKVELGYINTLGVHIRSLSMTISRERPGKLMSSFSGRHYITIPTGHQSEQGKLAYAPLYSKYRRTIHLTAKTTRDTGQEGPKNSSEKRIKRRIARICWCCGW